MEKARLRDVTYRTVKNWIGEAVEAADADGVKFPVQVTPHTFRHSYDMHVLYAGIPLKVLQSLMGHRSVSSTEIYTKVFALTPLGSVPDAGERGGDDTERTDLTAAG